MNEVEKAIQKAKRTNGTIRRLDELGRVVIPKDYRKGKVEDGITEVAVYHIKDYVVIEIVEKTNKKVDELGRVVINIEYRNKLGWNENDSIEIWNFDKYFILKKVTNECIFCNRKKDLVEYKAKKICKKCKNELIRV